MSAQRPPRNPFLLAGSVQPIIHYDVGQTDCVDVPMWLGDHVVSEDQVEYLPSPMGIPGAVHRPYADGTEAMLVSTNCAVLKVRIDGGRFDKVHELVVPGFESTHADSAEVAGLVAAMDDAWLDEPGFLAALRSYMVDHGVSAANAPFGLYTMVDKDGYLYAGYETTLFKFGDVGDASADSHLEVVASIDVRAGLAPEHRDGVNRFLGIGMTYDGRVIVALPGVIAAIDRDLTEVDGVPIPGEAVDNGISIDDAGGVYVVTSQYMRKLVWTGSRLSSDEADGAWAEPYDYVADKEGFWLSRGSGATPTLMGFGEHELVVLPDAGDPVKAIAFWRNEIPDDAPQVPGSASRRLAAALPLEFPVVTTVEWSPHVYGDGVMFMASDFPDPYPDGPYTLFTTLATMGYTREAPRGAQKFRWDHDTMSLTSDWVYMDRPVTWTLTPVSSPNNAVYLNTLEDGRWKIIGLDWDSGEQVAEITLPDSYKFNCAGGFIWPLPSGDLFVGGMFGPVLIRRR